MSSLGPRASCFLDHKLNWPTTPKARGISWTLTPTIHSSK